MAPSFDILGSFFSRVAILLSLGAVINDCEPMPADARACCDLCSRLDLSEPDSTLYVIAVARILSIEKENLMPVTTKTGRLVGIIVSGAIVTGAIVLGSVAIRGTEHNPRTDDSEILANFIGIAPQVDGPILHLNTLGITSS